MNPLQKAGAVWLSTLLLLLISLKSPHVNADPIDIPQIIQQMEDSLERDNSFNAQTCQELILNNTEDLFKEPSEDFFPSKNASPEELKLFKDQIDITLQKMFKMRLLLKEKELEFYQSQTLTSGCVEALRRAHRVLRSGEEFLIDWYQGHGILSLKAGPLLSAKKYQTQLNPFIYESQQGLEEKDFKTGDIFLIRGTTFLSALIARLGVEGSLFSHLTMIIESPEGKQYVAESLAFDDIKLTPLSKYLHEKEGRAVLYRFRDFNLAQKAGREFYNYLQKLKLEHKKLRYDYYMVLDDPGRLYCSELIRLIFGLQGVEVPLYLTQLDHFKHTHFLRDLGVKAPFLFSPGDLEVDPRFVIIGEYINLEKKRSLHLQDAALKSILTWSLDKDYRLQPNLKTEFIGQLGFFIRELGFLEKKIPGTMPESLLINLYKLQKTSNILERNLLEKEARYFRKHRFSMTLYDLMAINESFRKSDCRSQPLDRWLTPFWWQDPELRHFHHIYGPDHGHCD